MTIIVLGWTFGRQYLAPLAMAPLIFLLLFRSPLFRRNSQADVAPCPNCHASDTGGMNFCVQCGWDLSRADSAVGEAQEEMAPQRHEASAQSAAPVAEQADSREQEAVPAEAPAGDDTAQAVETPRYAPAADPVLAQDAVEAPVEPEVPAQPEPRPARPLPTPTNLTERGIELFNQGRFQEAIDQFTKAIALDPNYREAWARRAEAYGRVGRPERQKADQSRLEAI
ncbi:MAG: tetratricopeptide repeat protein [Chloroflexota bacterium]|nr:tetratricopeptide repeat protein [Chloroflexota bacterium]